MNKTLLLAVSFGTTHQATCDKNIKAVELRLQEAFPQTEVRRAFTSGMIRCSLQKQGVEVDDVPGALEKAANDGFTRVVLQPTHLLYGDEYEKMCTQADAYQNRFSKLSIAKPLLADTCDLKDMARTISTAFPATDGTALVLMGHGTEHYVNPVYAAMQTVFRLIGRRDVFVGTVEAWPGIDDVLRQLEDGDFSKAILTPLMLVAGDHAENDMAGDGDDSWKTLIQKKGIQAETVLRGLGEYSQVRDIYVGHAKHALEEQERQIPNKIE